MRGWGHERTDMLHHRAAAARVLQNLTGQVWNRFESLQQDDPMVRAMAVDGFEDEGFTVLEAPTADYAITLLSSRSDIGVVFTDITMPGALNGFDLARLVRRTYPHIHVLVSSGAVQREAPDARFIPKPYRMRDVVQIIRTMTG